MNNRIEKRTVLDPLRLAADVNKGIEVTKFSFFPYTFAHSILINHLIKEPWIETRISPQMNVNREIHPSRILK